jgi:AraC-like DNA-binding protein
VTNQAIGPDDRSGVLQPENLARYNATRFEPDPSVGDLVDQYWHVRWRLPRGESIHQRIIDLPAVTLTIEEGEVPAPMVATGVQTLAWDRTIAGTGSVFGIRLRPAGLAALSDLAPEAVADSAVPLTRTFDPKLHGLLTKVATAASAAERAELADCTISQLLAGQTLTDQQELANRAFDVLVREVRFRVGLDLVAELGASERSIQRALKATVGRGPKWISRRIRLQEVARQLATNPKIGLTTLGLSLGYTDQAHLTNDFRAVAGVSPDAYRRSLTGGA